MKKIRKFRKHLEDSGANFKENVRGKKKKKSLKYDRSFEEKRPYDYYYEEE